jgi:hypothetical protein
VQPLQVWIAQDCSPVRQALTCFDTATGMCVNATPYQ